MKLLSALIGLALLGTLAFSALDTTRTNRPVRDTDGAERVDAAATRPALRSTDLGERVDETASAVDGYYALPLGRRFEHAFGSELRTRMSQAVAPGEPARTVAMDLSFHGRIAATVVSTSPAELVLELTLADVEVDAGGATIAPPAGALERLGEELAAAHLVRIDRAGNALGYRFASGARPETRNLVRSLWSVLCCVIPDVGAERWAAEQADATGPLTMEYAWLERTGMGGRLSRTRRPVAARTAGPTTAEGRGETVLDPTLRWPSRVVYDETLALEAPEAGLRGSQESHHELTLLAHDLVDVSDRVPDLADGWAPVSGQAEQVADAPPTPPSGRELGSSDVTSLVLEIQALLDAGRLDSRELYEAELALAEWLNADPAHLDELRAIFRSGALEGDAAMVVLAAVGMAQHDAAQAFLAEQVAEPEAPTARRVAALQSAFQVAEPGEALLATIRTASLDESGPRDVRATALLALGTLASRASSDDTLDFLLEREGEARTDSELVLWLEALGNSGSPGILEHVTPYLVHESARVRTSAVSALRFLSGPEPVALLTRSATNDADSGVRATAVELLALSDSPEALEGVRTVLTQDAAPFVRRRAIQTLGTRQPLAEAVRTLLVTAAVSDADQALRALAEELLRG